MFFNSKDSVYDKVIKNIETIYQEYPNLFDTTIINMVIDPRYSLDKYAELFTVNVAMEKIRIQSTILDDIHKDVKNIYSREFIESYERYLEATNNFSFEGTSFPVHIPEHFAMAFLSPNLEGVINGLGETTGFPKTICPSGPCIPGKLRWMVDVNGRFFPCERVSETIEENVIGNIDKGFNLNKVKFVLNIHNLSKDKCINCFAFRYCSACIKKYEGYLSGDKTKLDKECNQIRNGFEATLNSIINFNERYG